MMNRTFLLFSALFVAYTAAVFGQSWDQSPLYISPRQTWMQRVTILGNPYMTYFLGGKPFSVVEESTYFHRPDDQTLEPRSRLTTYFYIDSYGRTRAERHVTSYIGGNEKSWLATIYITDQIAGFLYRLDPANHRATRWAWDLPSRQAALDRDREWEMKNSSAVVQALESQVETKYFGRNTRQGMNVEVWRQSLYVPAEAFGNEKAYEITVERWVSHDLGVAVFSTRDTGTTMRTTRLTKIEYTEPDKALFKVPADYKVEDAPEADTLVFEGVQP